MTVCRGKNRVLLHDSKQVIRIDLDESYVRPLNAIVGGQVWRAAVSTEGNKIGFIHHEARISDLKKLAVTIMDGNGKTEFTSWFQSPHVKPATPYDLKKPSQQIQWTASDSSLELNPYFSDDASTFVFVECDNEEDVGYVHFLTLGQSGVGPTWKAHSHPIIAAAAIARVNELTTVDKTGIVRNWKNRNLLSEWRIPSLEEVASVSIRGNSVLCLNWERDTQPTTFRSDALSLWTERRAVINGRVFDRYSGKLLVQMPEFAIIDKGTGTPKKSLTLTARDLAYLPQLSNDGRRIVQVVRIEDKFRIKCDHVESNSKLLEREIPEPLRVGFNRAGDRILVLRSIEPMKFALSVFDVDKGRDSEEFALSVRNDTERVLADWESITKSIGLPGQDFEGIWPFQAFVAFRSLGTRANLDWHSFFNHTGRFNLDNLEGPPLVLNLTDGRYLDFRHRTNAIRLRANDGFVIREVFMVSPLKSVWATVVDNDQTLLTMGPDSVLQLVDLKSGEVTGSIQLPFSRIDGFSESRESNKLLFWGDEGRLVVYEMTRN